MNFSMLGECIVICFALASLAAFVGEVIMTIQVKNVYLGLMSSLLGYVLSCNKCFSFWMSMCLTQDLFISAAVSICIVVIEFILDQIWIALDFKTKL